MNRRGISTLATMVALLTLIDMPTATLSQSILGIASVIDGDTIEIHSQRIRLYGIDAPEGDQPCMRSTGERWRCGQQASFALADRIGRATISFQARDPVCFKGNEDLSRWMVITGWAVVAPEVIAAWR